MVLVLFQFGDLSALLLNLIPEGVYLSALNGNVPFEGLNFLCNWQGVLKGIGDFLTGFADGLEFSLRNFEGLFIIPFGLLEHLNFSL